MRRAHVLFVLFIGLNHVTNAMVTHDRQALVKMMDQYCEIPRDNHNYTPTVLQLPEEYTSISIYSCVGFYRNVIDTDKISERTNPFLVKLLSILLLRLLLRDVNPLGLYMATTAILNSEVMVSGLIVTSSFSTTPSGTYIRGECDEGWIQVNTSCYFPASEPMKFDHAQRACSYHAAGLVTIHSQWENTLVFNIARDFLANPGVLPVWIGMERIKRLQWVDSSNIGYSNWILGEPDSNGACVQMILNGYWEDASCGQKLKFICRKPSSFPPPYTRSTELAIMVGIPLAFSTIVVVVVAVLVCKSIKDADGTFFGYGKNRNKERMHAAIVDVTASIAHIKAQRGFDETHADTRPQSPVSSHNNNGLDVGNEEPGPSTRVSGSRRNSEDKKEFAKSTNANSQTGEEIEIQICGSSTSIEQEPRGFQSTTSLDYLVSKSFITPKTRNLRGINTLEATVRPAGRQGVYRKKNSFKKKAAKST